MMLDYALLEALVAVTRQGSFEKAARALHVTSSAISQRIKLLEERVGAVLVVRGQPCVATEAGEALCQHTERVALLEHELAADLPARAPTSVRIAVNADSVATWFVKAVAQRSAELGVVFDLVVDDQDHTAESLRRGAVQAAVTTSAEPVRGAQVKRLGRMRFIATCSPAFHARYFKAGVTRQTLQRAPILIFDGKDRLQHRFMRKAVHAELEPPAHRVPSLHGFLEACRSGMAWAMNPESLVRDELASGALVPVLDDCAIDVRLFWQRIGLPSTTLDAVTECVVSAARRELLP
jgi:LysR family transcriptional regulator, chromosome initiation inhibitor